MFPLFQATNTKDEFWYVTYLNWYLPSLWHEWHSLSGVWAFPRGCMLDRELIPYNCNSLTLFILKEVQDQIRAEICITFLSVWPGQWNKPAPWEDKSVLNHSLRRIQSIPVGIAWWRTSGFCGPNLWQRVHVATDQEAEWGQNQRPTCNLQSRPILIYFFKLGPTPWRWWRKVIG